MRPLLEKVLVSVMDGKYGVDYRRRFEKLKEEFGELEEAFNDQVREHTLETKSHLMDEMADVMAVMTHLASVLGSSVEELQLEAYKKIIIRDHNPKYLKDNEI